MRKAVLVLLVLAVIGAAGWFAYQRYQQARAAAARPDWEVVTVQRGNVAATVSATGSVTPERETNLAFQSSGTINEVNVSTGSEVKKGDTLARLDTVDLDLAVRQAEIGLQQAQAQERQLNDGPQESEIAAAEASLSSAQEAYQQLLNGTSADERQAAAAQVEQARVSLEQAQQAYDKVKDRPDVGLLPQSLQLQQATVNYDTAQAQYRVSTKGATVAQKAQAQAQVAQAQANLDRLKKGATQAQLDVAKAGVEQAALALEQAQRRLENATLVAPWDGVVTNVAIVAGALAQPGQPAVQLADVGKYHLDVAVDEVDVAALAEGQPVTIEVDALPDQQLSGKVARIAPAAQTEPTGGVTYSVRIDIDPTDAPLLAGMSTTATITANERNNVLLIPNRAVQFERETGRTFVERLVDGEPQRVEVRLGLRDEQRVEVRDGLEEGDQLAIRSVSSLQRLQQQFGGGF